ncbi:MAG: GTP-binding protein [Promethearchaeota archaeon]
MPDEYFIKICIMGSARELKTKMVNTFVGGKFTTSHLPTLGVDITTKQIKVNDFNVHLVLVDTIGQEFFGKLRSSYFRGASAAIITFEKVNRNSFHNVKDWFNELKKHLPQATFPIALVGFISDSEEITSFEGQGLAEELNVPYYETTPTDKATIEGIFHNLARKVVQNIIRTLACWDRD